MLTPITDAFIAVAESHGQFLAKNYRCRSTGSPSFRDGVDTQRFTVNNVTKIRSEFASDQRPVVGIVPLCVPRKESWLLFLRSLILDNMSRTCPGRARPRGHRARRRRIRSAGRTLCRTHHPAAVRFTGAAEDRHTNPKDLRTSRITSRNAKPYCCRPPVRCRASSSPAGRGAAKRRWLWKGQAPLQGRQTGRPFCYNKGLGQYLQDPDFRTGPRARPVSTGQFHEYARMLGPAGRFGRSL